MEWLELFNNDKNYLEKIIKVNEKTERFGLRLSKEDVAYLIESRKESLKEYQRVEFGEGIIEKLVFEFCDSPYIYQDNYVETISKLQDIFYLYKNESLDELSDDELLDYMKNEFNNECQGSLEYLEETVLESLARKIRIKGLIYNENGEITDD